MSNIDPNGELAFVPILFAVAACSASPACRGVVGAVGGGVVGGAASSVDQMTDGVDGFDAVRVGIDAGKGAIVGGVSAATLNPKAGAGTAAVLGAVDGGISSGVDGDPDTSVVGGAVEGAIVEGGAALIGGALGRKVSDVPFPTGETIGTVTGAASAPVIEQTIDEAVEKSCSSMESSKFAQC